MTFPACFPSPKFLRNAGALILAVFLLQACATPEDSESLHHRPDQSSSRFEWAVQHFEAGSYDQAVKSFTELKKDGPALTDYDLLPYYLGMSHFRLGQYELAAGELEDFLKGSSERREAQEARITLLLVYERLERWRDVATLARESDKVTLYQDSRALLKLVWTRALRELGELQGARAALEEAQPFLDKAGTDDGSKPFYADPDRDLWGRFYFTRLLIEESACQAPLPREVEQKLSPKLAAELKKKKAKPPPPRRLYASWLEGVIDCQRTAVGQAADDLFIRDTPWVHPGLQALEFGLQDFAGKIQKFQHDEAGALDRQRNLQKGARENLYRLMNLLESKIKAFKERDLNPESLETLRKSVDHLLVQISSP